MGTYNKGILGPFSGKVGTVVGASWRGKDVLRSLPRASDKLPTENQLLQRLKFRTVLRFLGSFSAVINKFYGSNSGEKTRNNQAMSYHLQEAVTYVAPVFEIKFTKVQISKGDLLGVQSPTIAAGAGTSLDFDWLDNSGQGQALGTDQLVVVVYEPISKLSFYSLNAGMRQDLSANLVLPSYFAGLEVQTWITFVSADQKRYATSEYMNGVLVN